jgi:hypothetical protein
MRLTMSTIKMRVAHSGGRCNCTLATGKRGGRKKERECATFSLCCNASGTHSMELFVIGKAACRRSFLKNFQPRRDFFMRYAHNKTAWMTATEFFLAVSKESTMA